MSLDQARSVPIASEQLSVATPRLEPLTIWHRLRGLASKLQERRRRRTMRLCETLSLGEKRFLAVVMVEGQRFLVGGAGNSVALLAELPAEPQLQQTEQSPTR